MILVLVYYIYFLFNHVRCYFLENMSTLMPLEPAHTLIGKIDLNTSDITGKKKLEKK